MSKPRKAAILLTLASVMAFAPSTALAKSYSAASLAKPFVGSMPACPTLPVK